MIIKFDNPQEEEDFINWVESKEKNNSEEMKSLRRSLDIIRDKRNAMKTLNYKK